MEPHAQPAPAPSPPPPRAPRAHPVLSVPEDTHALGHLGERERMLSAVSRARWPPADSVRDLRTPGGNPLTRITLRQPAPPTHRRSRRGSTSLESSCSALRIPAGTQEVSPCTGWHCTLERVGRGSGAPTAFPVGPGCGRDARPWHIHLRHPHPGVHSRSPSPPQAQGRGSLAGQWGERTGWTCTATPLGPRARPAGAALLQEVTLQQVSVGSTSVTR